MKRRITLAILIVSAAVGLASASDQPQPKFSFVVRPSANGVQLECKSGCAWETLTADCSEAPCEFRVDEFGIRGQ